MLKLPSGSHPLENKLFLVSAKCLVSKLFFFVSFLFSPQAFRPSKRDYNISNSNLIYSGSHKNKQHTQILIETSYTYKAKDISFKTIKQWLRKAISID